MAAVTNDKRRIANTNTGFQEQNLGDLDANKKPDLSIHMHKNEGPLAKAIDKTSDKTKFEGGNVVRVKDLVATEKPHPGTVGGVTSGTYLKEAWAEEGAKTVLCENKAPTRFFDGTQQNQANSTGKVVNPADAEKLAKLLEEMKKRCTVEQFVTAECGHGRDIKEFRNLEVVASAKEPEKIFLEAERKNAVATGPAVCLLGTKHTEWTVSRKKGGGLEALEKVYNQDKLTLEPDWFSEVDPESLEVENEDDAYKDANRHADDIARQAARDQRAQAIHDRSKMLREQNPNQGGSVAQAKGEFDQFAPNFERDAANRAKAARAPYKNGRAIARDVQDKVDKLTKFVDFAKNWFARNDPVRVNVQGQACTGALACEIVAFPADEVEWELAESDKALVKRATEAVEKGAKFLTGVFAPLGNVSVEMKVLEEASITAKNQWKELTRDAPRPGLKKYQCNTNLTVEFAIGKVFFIEIKASVPLARLLNFIIPPPAAFAVEKAMNWFGLTAQGYVSISAGVGVSLSLKLNEYWEGEPPAPELKFEFKVAIGIELRYRDNLHIKGEAAAKWEPKFENLQFERDALFAVDFNADAIQLGFEGQIYVSFWWFEYSKSATYYPEAWKIQLGKTTLRPLKPLMSLLKN